MDLVRESRYRVSPKRSARKQSIAIIVVCVISVSLAVLFSRQAVVQSHALGLWNVFTARLFDGGLIVPPVSAWLAIFAALFAGTAILAGFCARSVSSAATGIDTAAIQQNPRDPATARTLPAAMIHTDTDGTVNRSAAQPDLHEHPNEGESKLFLKLSPDRQSDGQRSIDRIAQIGADLVASGRSRFDWRHTDPNGVAVDLDVTMTVVRSNGDRDIVADWTDVTVQRPAGETVRETRPVQPTDITSQVAALAAANAELKEAKDRSDHVAKLRSDFLATMSHEFRGPLNSLVGFVELASDGNLDSEQAGFLAKALLAGRHLASIVDDVLDLTRAEAGRLELESLSFDLIDFAHSTLEMIEPALRDKKVELVLDVSPDLPLQITADPLRLRQIVMNFLTNAAKFTSSGEIVLALRRIDRDGQTFLRISVEDSGIGLQADQKARLFNNFSQADASIARLYGGSGLGLAICQQLATLMQGQVGFSSEAGRGSCFWFDLPTAGHVDWNAAPARSSSGTGRVVWIGIANPRLRNILRSFLEYDGFTVEDLDVEIATSLSGTVAIYDSVEHLRVLGLAGHKPAGKAPESFIKTPVHPRHLMACLSELSGIAQPRSVPDAHPVAPLRDHAILVVDDDELNRDLAYSRLTRLGLSVRTASNGAEALQAVLDEPFDLILMDHQMPGMDGVEATRRIRALALPLARIPIVGVSGSDRLDVRQACEQAGMDGFFLKPLNQKKLVEIVEQFLPDQGSVPATKTRPPIGKP